MSFREIYKIINFAMNIKVKNNNNVAKFYFLIILEPYFTEIEVPITLEPCHLEASFLLFGLV